MAGVGDGTAGQLLTQPRPTARGRAQCLCGARQPGQTQRCPHQACPHQSSWLRRGCGASWGLSPPIPNLQHTGGAQTLPRREGSSGKPTNRLMAGISSQRHERKTGATKGNNQRFWESSRTESMRANLGTVGRPRLDAEGSLHFSERERKLGTEHRPQEAHTLQFQKDRGRKPSRRVSQNRGLGFRPEGPPARPAEWTERTRVFAFLEFQLRHPLPRGSENFPGAPRGKEQISGKALSLRVWASRGRLEAGRPRESACR